MPSGLLHPLADPTLITFSMTMQIWHPHPCVFGHHDSSSKGHKKSKTPLPDRGHESSCSLAEVRPQTILLNPPQTLNAPMPCPSVSSLLSGLLPVCVVYRVFSLSNKSLILLQSRVSYSVLCLEHQERGQDRPPGKNGTSVCTPNSAFLSFVCVEVPLCGGRSQRSGNMGCKLSAWSRRLKLFGLRTLLHSLQTPVNFILWVFLTTNYYIHN